MNEIDLSKKKNIVKEKIKEYIQEYYKRLQTPGTPTQSINMYKFKNLEDIIYRLDKQDKLKASKSTVQLALSELRETITKRDGFYQYTDEALRANAHFPILKFAKDIEIVNLNLRQFAFYRVFPNVTSEVVNYLNTVIVENDIYSVAIGDIIMCIDVGYEEDNENSYLKKDEDFKDHITRILFEGNFNLANYTNTEDRDINEEVTNNDGQEEISYNDQPYTKREMELYDNILEEIDSIVEKRVTKYLTEFFTTKK